MKKKTNKSISYIYKMRPNKKGKNCIRKITKQQFEDEMSIPTMKTIKDLEKRIEVLENKIEFKMDRTELVDEEKLTKIIKPQYKVGDFVEYIRPVSFLRNSKQIIDTGIIKNIYNEGKQLVYEMKDGWHAYSYSIIGYVKQDLLTPEEKHALKSIFGLFKHKVINLTKHEHNNFMLIIKTEDGKEYWPEIVLPYAFNGLKLGKEYKIEELGL